jgi:heterodisulfide reductase subunit A-like polyferredoxin/coenzyme F420-reducing hydrogenase delta subunit
MTLGVYLSRCSGKVDEVIDVDEALAGVRDRAAVIRIFDDLFDPAVADRIAHDIADAELDGVVLAGHSAEHYAKSLSGGHLKDRIRAAGVNPNRIGIANILEQAALAHPDDHAGATAKARALIDVAVLRAEMSPEAVGTYSEPRRSVLVLGVTSEAVVAAQRLLQLGYNVILADRESGSDKAAHAASLRATAGFVLGHPAAEFVDNVHLADGEGWLGDFKLTLEGPDGRSTHRVGGILLARPDDQDWINDLRGHFKVDIDEDGHARALAPGTHPAETVDPGIMVVPFRAHGLSEREKIAAADSAVLALVLRLSQPQTVHYSDTSAVDESLCGGCATCVRTCAFGACSLDANGVSHVDVRRCRGCGKCVVSCPVGARDIVSSPHDYLMSAVRSLAATPTPAQKVIGFLCSGCGYPAADEGAAFVAERGTGYPASFLPLRIPCGGRLDTLYVLEAFKAGFDAVAVYRCREGHCHNLIGNLDMDRRINLLRTVLRSRNIDDARLRIVDISPFEGERFVESVEAVYETIGSLPVSGGAR